MTIKSAARAAGLTEATARALRKSVFAVVRSGKLIGGKKRDEAAELIMIANLMMARFEPTDVKQMLERPETAAAAADRHLLKLKDRYPKLYEALRRIDLAAVRDVYALSDKVKECFVLPESERAVYDELRKLCRELREPLHGAEKLYRAANIIDLPAMIPVIGFPFGFLRSALLSKGKKKKDGLSERVDRLSDALKKLSFRVDMTAAAEPDGYGGMMGDYIIPNMSEGYYLYEAESEVREQSERIVSINTLLDRIRV